MRIGINVPNELISQVKAIDPEVNISQLCRDALKTYVAEADRITERIAIDGMDEHAVRFAMLYEHPLNPPDWIGYALDDAQEWLSRIEPDKWEWFIMFYEDHKALGRDLFNLPAPDPIRGFHYWQRKHEDWYEWQYMNGNDTFMSDWRKYDSTWRSYVEKVREKQLEILEDKRQKELIGRKEALKARPEPEVPQQLLN